MNLVENWLKEIIEVKKIEDDWTKTEEWAKGKEWLSVKATWDCYGREETCTKVYTVKERIRLTKEYLNRYYIENMNGFLYLQKKEVFNSEK